VETGCLTVDVRLPGKRRQIVLLLYAGEAVPPGLGSIAADIALTAALASTLTRTSDRCGSLQTQVARVLARSALHVLVLGRSTGEERVASLVAELATHLAPTQRPGEAAAWSFEMPLTREDMADYLAMNPDSLSRVMSRLRARRLIVAPRRNLLVVPDPAALIARCPLASHVAAGARAEAGRDQQHRRD